MPLKQEQRSMKNAAGLLVFSAGVRLPITTGREQRQILERVILIVLRLIFLVLRRTKHGSPHVPQQGLAGFAGLFGNVFFQCGDYAMLTECISVL